MKRLSIAILLTAIGFALAAPPTTRPGLHLQVPHGWAQRQVKSPDGKTPAKIVITATGPDGPLEVTIQPIPLGPKVLTDDELKKIIESIGQPMLADSVEKEIALKPVEGSAKGFEFTLTPTGGKKLCLTEVVVQLPGLALAAAITHRADSPAIDSAVDIVRQATYGQPGPKNAKP